MRTAAADNEPLRANSTAASYGASRSTASIASRDMTANIERENAITAAITTTTSRIAANT
jgi:hypothetical protein